MMGDLNKFDHEIDEADGRTFLFNMSAQPALVKKMIEAQLDDNKVRFLIDKVLRDS